MAEDHQAAVDWLLGSDEPAVRFLTRRDVLGEAADEDESKIMSGPKVTALLAGQRDNGEFWGAPLSFATIAGAAERRKKS